MKWFGHPWGTVICDPAAQVDVPILSRCAGCERSIRPWSQGVIVPSGPAELPYHLHCYRVTLGLAEPHTSVDCYLDPGHAGRCRKWGERLPRPALRLSLTHLQPLDDPERDWYQCRVCQHGRIGIHRSIPGFRLQRNNYCMRCGQRYHFTDALHRGEPFDGEAVQ